MREVERMISMEFSPKPTKQKVKAGYKSLYISDELAEKVSDLAKKHNTSFNNIVISILENFFENKNK
ncbi:MAG: hypothetical protein IJE62_01085 [Clostridia bacterium]|nr:hypothetical protein [Clostridia bacterium]